jgi:hypothetical protein
MTDAVDPNAILIYNANARRAILGATVDTWQQIYAQGVIPANGNILNIAIRNVGLVKGFLVRIEGTIRNTDGAKTATRSELGASNLISQFTFTDLSNTVRINTTGWHIHLINSAKQALVFGGAYAPNIPVGYGNNWNVQTAAASIGPGVDAAVSFFYYIPLAYSKDDLRGAMFASVINSTSSLQVTINPTPMVDAGADATLAVYGGSVGGWKAATNVTVTVWQNYLDQLPRDQNGQYILPPLDLNTIYELKNTALPSPVAAQDYGIPYANYRTFLSTVVIYDNGGTLNTGSDINYWALRAANTTEIFKYPPEVAALFARTTFYSDPPKGVYYFDFRSRPINTQQFGNMELTVNAKTVNANAALLVGFENFASVSQVSQASSLPTAG